MFLVILTPLIIILTLVFIRDTQVKVYDCWNKFLHEEPLLLPIWKYIVIILVGFIPILNVIFFIFFLIAYMLPPSHVGNNKKVSFHLRGDNFLTSFILKIKRFLNKKI